jgi:hypothetical protein
VRWARRVTTSVGESDLRHAVQVMERLIATVPEIEVRPGATSPEGGSGEVRA